MKIKHKFLIAGIISLGYYLSSLFLNIIPCKTSPNVPNPQYLWSVCNLNPDNFVSTGVQKLFFGVSSKLTDGTLLALIIPFLAIILILSIGFKKSKKEE